MFPSQSSKGKPQRGRERSAAAVFHQNSFIMCCCTIRFHNTVQKLFLSFFFFVRSPKAWHLLEFPFPPLRPPSPHSQSAGMKGALLFHHSSLQSGVFVLVGMYFPPLLRLHRRLAAENNMGKSVLPWIVLLCMCTSGESLLQRFF